MLLFRDFIDRFGQRQANGEIAFTPIISSLIVSLMSIGTLIGALSGAYTADWWGRRKSMSFGVSIFIVGNVIQITAMTSWVHMMMGRFVAGLGVGNLSVGVPMFQSECCPKEIRGAVVASYQLMITFGKRYHKARVFKKPISRILHRHSHLQYRQLWSPGN